MKDNVMCEEIAATNAEVESLAIERATREAEVERRRQAMADFAAENPREYALFRRCGEIHESYLLGWGTTVDLL